MLPSTVISPSCSPCIKPHVKPTAGKNRGVERTEFTLRDLPHHVSAVYTQELHCTADLLFLLVVRVSINIKLSQKDRGSEQASESWREGQEEGRQGKEVENKQLARKRQLGAQSVRKAEEQGLG